MKQFLKMGLVLLALNHVGGKLAAQGCVAIRSTGGSCMMDHSEVDNGPKQKWTFNANTRYFKSYRHFRGTEEETARVANGTEVINHSYNMDFLLSYNRNSRWAFSVIVPLIRNTRSSLYEHGGSSRHGTASAGLGDLRLTAYRTLLNPSKHQKANIQLGLGVKLPTGNYKYQDNFYTNTGSTVKAPVDQSIQLGDGGLGFTTELSTYYILPRNVSLNANAYYLANPRETNGVSATRNVTPTAAQLAYTTDVMSVADQYMARLGISYKADAFSVSAGLRLEGIPSNDLIGGEKGFRRPGYVISAEPGVTYRHQRLNFYATLPFALKRARTQSYPDKLRSEITGQSFTGDAAFADYSVNAGVSFKF